MNRFTVYHISIWVTVNKLINFKSRFFTYRMGRVKKEERKIGNHSEKTMLRAILLVRNGETIRKAAKECKLPYPTLRRYVRKYEKDENTNLVPNYEVNSIFTSSQEKELKEYIIDCSNKFYGLTAKDTRRLAYQMAIMNDIKVPPSWEERKMAGKEWLRSFRKRHPDISLKKPEPCSLARASAFNKMNVQTFFKNLKDAMQRSPNFGNGTRVYNLDETSTTTVQRPQKVLALKGSSVCKVTSGERGVLVTTCCIVSATGHALPPAMVFPRKKFKSHMLHGAPSGTLGLAASSGWMNAEIFVDVMKHFIKHTSASKDNPALLILDNHESHLSIETLNLAKSSGVTLLTLPPHTTARLQPLDVGLNAPFKSYYNAAVDSWMLRNPGQAFTIYHVAQCAGEAYLKAMTPMNITDSFKKCGIYPYDESVFTEEDFLPSSVTDRPDPGKENEEPDAEMEIHDNSPPTPCSPTILQEESLQEIQDILFQSQAELPQEINKLSTIINNLPEAQTSCNKKPQQHEACSSTSKDMKSFISPKMFRPPLKAGPRKTKRCRPLGKSMIATDTPEKDLIAARKNKDKVKVKKVKTGDLFQEKKKSKKKETVIIDDDSGEEGSFCASGSSSGGEQFLSDSEDDEIILTEDFSPLPRNPNVGDFVIVLIESEKTKKKCYYIAKIIDNSPESGFDYSVSYLKLKSKVYHTFAEPMEPDMAMVSKNDIKYILPNPKVEGSSRRTGTFRFPMNLSLLNFPF